MNKLILLSVMLLVSCNRYIGEYPMYRGKNYYIVLKKKMNVDSIGIENIPKKYIHKVYTNGQ